MVPHLEIVHLSDHVDLAGHAGRLAQTRREDYASLHVAPPPLAPHAAEGEGKLAERDTLVAWAGTVAFDNQPIRTARVDPAGNLVWKPASGALKTSATSPSRLAGALSSAGFAAYAWTDGESARDLKAQNLNFDGTLGVAAIFADGFECGATLNWDDV